MGQTSPPSKPSKYRHWVFPLLLWLLQVPKISLLSRVIVLYCCCSIAKSYPTLCDPMESFTISGSLLKITSIEKKKLSNHIICHRHLVLLLCVCVCVCVCVCEFLSHVQLFVTPRTVACQAPRSMGLSRQEYWSGLPFPSSGALCNPRIEPGSPALQADPLLSDPSGKPSPSASDACFPRHVSPLPFC